MPYCFCLYNWSEFSSRSCLSTLWHGHVELFWIQATRDTIRNGVCYTVHSLCEPGVGPEDPCGSHPTWDTLGFCDQVQYFFCCLVPVLRLDGLHENFSSVCEKKTKVISSSDGFRKKTSKISARRTQSSEGQQNTNICFCGFCLGSDLWFCVSGATDTDWVLTGFCRTWIV